MLKESAAAERPGRLPLPVGAFHQASWAAKGLCTMAVWVAPAEPSCRTSWKPPCLAARARHNLPFQSCQAATLQPYTPGLTEGLCHQLHLIEVACVRACMHVGRLELPDYILFYVPQPDVSQPLNKPLLQTVCYAKDKERTWGLLSLGVHCSTV